MDYAFCYGPSFYNMQAAPGSFLRIGLTPEKVAELKDQQ
jgi:hypothetical protein